MAKALYYRSDLISWSLKELLLAFLVLLQIPVLTLVWEIILQLPYNSESYFLVWEKNGPPGMCQLLICFRPEIRPGGTASIWKCPLGNLRAYSDSQERGSRLEGANPEVFLLVHLTAFDWSAICIPYLCLGPDRSPHSLSPETCYFSFKKLYKSHFYFYD